MNFILVWEVHVFDVRDKHRLCLTNISQMTWVLDSLQIYNVLKMFGVSLKQR